MNKLSHKDYLHLLEPWVKASEKYLYSPPKRKDLVCYGTGYNGWGVQTHQKAFAAFAVMAADPDLDEKNVGMTREQMLDLALKMLRYTLESHIEGSYNCEDGTSWGHTWISTLGIERMMHGVEAIDVHLTKQDGELLQKVLESESDWLMDHYEIVAGTIQNNKPESNLWNGSLLHRTAAMYPFLPRTQEYRTKGSCFLANSISIASDATSSTIVDGKPLSEWFIGDNFFKSYGLNHHRYLNVGYMVICLSNAAILHFMYKKRGLNPPQALYHHVKDLWDVVKQFVFEDGRLIRIGGDTRVRYCYCQDYLIPVLLMMKDVYKDGDSISLETKWLATVDKEMKFNHDGTYLSSRCKDLEDRAPIYYTRLEADRAVCLSYGAYWRRLYDTLNSDNKSLTEQCLPYSWYDEYHGACFVKGKNRLASFTWFAAERPQGLCLPMEGSDLAEWRYNLAGRIKGSGVFNYNEVVSHKENCFEGGFITFGTLMICSEELVSEQQTKDIIGTHKVAFTALPDDCTVMVMQYAKTNNRSYVTSVQGLLLQVPNDLFNDCKRTYYYHNQKENISGFGSREGILDTESSWLNIDDRLSVVKAYGVDSLTVYRPGRRQIGTNQRYHSETMGMLYADEICCPFYKGLKDVDPDTMLIDTGFVVQAGIEKQETAEYCAKTLCTELKTDNDASPEVRVMIAHGVDKQKYILVSNFGEQASLVTLSLPGVERVQDIVKKNDICVNENKFSLKIAADEAKLYVAI